MDPPDGDLFQIRLKYIEQLSYAMIIFAIILLQTLFYINMVNSGRLGIREALLQQRSACYPSFPPRSLLFFPGQVTKMAPASTAAPPAI